MTHAPTEPCPRFNFRHRLRVRWVEVDAQQVVFNGHYLTYLDVAMTEYWRAVGLPYPEGFTHLGGDIFVRRNVLDYHAPARLDDWLEVGVRCARVGNSSITVAWAIEAGGRRLVDGETVYVYTDRTSRRPAQVPPALREQLQAQAEGRPVYSLQCGTWQDLGEHARRVRQAVFVMEQGIPEAEEWDEDDEHALHAVLSNRAGLAVATGRLITWRQPPGQAKIGRMAVLHRVRGTGLGAHVMSGLLDQARKRGVSAVSLHAQVSAQPFYARAGFQPEGEVFDEVGIPHITMTLRI